MRRRVTTFAAILVLSTGFAAGASAQPPRHVIDPAVVLQTLQHDEAIRDQNRAAVRAVLGRPDVQAMAKRLGIDLARMDAAVDSMNDRDLASAATAARDATQSLVGGASSVTLSTTTIIIGLLVLILIIVAVK